MPVAYFFPHLFHEQLVAFPTPAENCTAVRVVAGLALNLELSPMIGNSSHSSSLENEVSEVSRTEETVFNCFPLNYLLINYYLPHFTFSTFRRGI